MRIIKSNSKHTVRKSVNFFYVTACGSRAKVWTYRVG